MSTTAQLHHSAPASLPTSERLALHLVYPEEVSGRRIELRSSLVLGRVPDSDVEELRHGTVSGRHAQIEQRDDGLWLTDLGSRNGTSVDGAELRGPALLQPQSVVRLGDVLGVVGSMSDPPFDASRSLPNEGSIHERLAALQAELPPVCQRRQDIFDWLEWLSNGASATLAIRPRLLLLPDAAERILMHRWPDDLAGLVRLIERLTALQPDLPIGVRALCEAFPELETPGLATRSRRAAARSDVKMVSPYARSRPTREEFVAVYEATGRSVRATSKRLGRDRRQIYRWLEIFGIERARAQTG